MKFISHSYPPSRPLHSQLTMRIINYLFISLRYYHWPNIFIDRPKALWVDIGCSLTVHPSNRIGISMGEKWNGRVFVWEIRYSPLGCDRNRSRRRIRGARALLLSAALLCLMYYPIGEYRKVLLNCCHFMAYLLLLLYWISPCFVYSLGNSLV